jgi:hypothetical protein
VCAFFADCAARLSMMTSTNSSKRWLSYRGRL